MTRYQQLADILSERIEQGLYSCGERLPSVRLLSEEHGVSISTVQQAYRSLEKCLLIEARAKSGYFVRGNPRRPELPAVCRHAQRPVEISQWEHTLAFLHDSTEEDVLHLGSGTPDSSGPGLKVLSRLLSRISLHQSEAIMAYGSLQGSLILREQIARLMLDSGNHQSAENIIITAGCHGALAIALGAVCQPGDIVAVDSPSFHGAMQSLKGMGMKVIEIPTDPVIGISLEALEMALEQWPIKAVQLTPTCNNPLGYNMPDGRKKALLTLAQRYDIAIIEDDVYGSLAYQYPRPATIASFDDDGRVLLCSSFSKTLAPGLRVGWIAPGRYLEKALHIKYITAGRTPTLQQLAVAEFIRQGDFTQHLRRMRRQYQQNLDIMTHWVTKYFPPSTCLSRPQGGFMLWVELPEGFDSLRLNRILLPHKVQIAAGFISSASGKYRNSLRLCFSKPMTDEIEQAVKLVGKTVSEILAEG
ncbi:GntR family transcriptional regulator [Yersinia entomophaga]|uniref:GntR family transcriptional regulator n=1 Tax=Yersinia entomophaga TaxID=935293 RepID=A0ABN4PSE8_YERET|nr:PLP-dependent aminotransferase family protein [Yersinia entomophaga]ANI28671.1 GntR family transcriptional regulator [Yersinia entomophaga]OWF89788.1 GntR family transcriptional regulator [Yersinia entomophaga]